MLFSAIQNLAKFNENEQRILLDTRIDDVEHNPDS